MQILQKFFCGNNIFLTCCTSSNRVSILKINVTTLSNHLKRAHPNSFKDFEKDHQKAKEKSKFKSGKKNLLAVSQRRITDFTTISPTMTLAVELVVNKGVSFSTFDDSTMRKLTSAAKKGSNDHSSTTVGRPSLSSHKQNFFKRL
jgi:hypothetical protein